MEIGNTYPALGRPWFQAPSEVAGGSVPGQENAVLLSLDVSLPLSHLPEFLGRAALIAQTARLRPMLVAHLGDGNLQYAVIAQQGHIWDDLDVMRAIKRVIDPAGLLNPGVLLEHG